MSLAVSVLLLGAVLALWLVGVIRPRRALAAFLCAALYNYWYVIGLGWSVAWASEGGVSEGAPTIIKYGKDLGFLGVCAAHLVWVAFRGVPNGFRLVPMDVLVYAVLGYGVLLSLPSLVLLGPLTAIAWWQNFGYALVYPCVRLALARSTIDDVRRTERWLYVHAAAVAVIGIVQFTVGPAPYAYLSGPYAGVNRAVSTLGNPNNFGFVLGLFALWALATRRRSPANLLISGGGLLSLSVTAVGGSMAVAAALLLRQIRVGLLALLISAGLAGALVAALVAPTATTRVQRVLAGEDESMVARLENWQRLVPRNPLVAVLGQGTGQGGAITVSFHQNEGLLADNQYLALLTQYGAVGLVLFIALVGTTVLPLVLDETPRRGWSEARLGAAAGVAAIAVFGVSANVLNMFPVNLLFWTLLAVSAGSDSVRHVPPPRPVLGGAA